MSTAAIDLIYGLNKFFAQNDSVFLQLLTCIGGHDFYLLFLSTNFFWSLVLFKLPKVKKQKIKSYFFHLFKVPYKTGSTAIFSILNIPWLIFWLFGLVYQNCIHYMAKYPVHKYFLFPLSTTPHISSRRYSYVSTHTYWLEYS